MMNSCDHSYEYALTPTGDIDYDVASCKHCGDRMIVDEKKKTKMTEEKQNYVKERNTVTEKQHFVFVTVLGSGSHTNNIGPFTSLAAAEKAAEKISWSGWQVNTKAYST